MSKLFQSVISLLMLSSVVLNAQSLLPNESIFDIKNYQWVYFAKVSYKLFENLSDDPKVRIVVKPSFSPEYVFQIEKNKEEIYFAKLNVASEKIWYSKNFDSVTIQEFSAEIEEDDAELFSEILSKILKNTHFKSKPNFTTDGVTYNVSAGMLSGTFRSGDDFDDGLFRILNNTIEKLKNNESKVSFTENEIKSLNEIKQKLDKNPSIENYKIALKIKELIEINKGHYLKILSKSHQIEFEKLLYDLEKDVLLKLAFNDLEMNNLLDNIKYYETRFLSVINYKTSENDATNIDKYKKLNNEENIFKKIENSLK